MKFFRLITWPALVLALVFCFSACSAPVNQPEDDQQEEDPPPEDRFAAMELNLATGTTSGNYYPYGNALAQVVEDASGYIQFNINATTASAENIGQLADGQAQVAIAQNDMLYYAFHGIDVWTEKTPVTTMASLMSLYPEICQVIVAADSDIEGIADLKDKRVALGDEGSALAAGARQILTAYELNPDEDMEAQYLGFVAAAEALKERSIDALFITVGTPNKAVMDLQAARDIRLLSLDEDKMAELMERYPFYTRATLTKNDYSFLGEEDIINTLAVQATLVSSSALTDQAAYDIVKALIEGREDMAKAHPKGAFLNAEHAVSGLGIPIHPGAERYFKEIGIL